MFTLIPLSKDKHSAGFLPPPLTLCLPAFFVLFMNCDSDLLYIQNWFYADRRRLRGSDIELIILYAHTRVIIVYDSVKHRRCFFNVWLPPLSFGGGGGQLFSSLSLISLMLLFPRCAAVSLFLFFFYVFFFCCFISNARDRRSGMNRDAPADEFPPRH